MKKDASTILLSPLFIKEGSTKITRAWYDKFTVKEAVEIAKKRLKTSLPVKEKQQYEAFLARYDKSSFDTGSASTPQKLI
jgi:hypothetical protein